MANLPECCYRVSVKALILNETRDKFLVCEEADGTWELPGGGLDWGVSPQEDVAREIKEEMGLEVTNVADNPCYFLSFQSERTGTWMANIVYEVTVKDLDFTPSDECISVKFVDQADVANMTVFEQVASLVNRFDPKNHQ